jgi:hypothetical protein
MKTLRVGVLLEPQYTTFSSYAEAVRQVESLGVDTLWNYDHFLPPYGNHKGNHLGLDAADGHSDDRVAFGQETTAQV